MYSHHQPILGYCSENRQKQSYFCDIDQCAEYKVIFPTLGKTRHVSSELLEMSDMEHIIRTQRKPQRLE